MLLLCRWWGCAATKGETGGQLPRGLSPEPAPGETEAQGRNLQAAVLSPLPSPTLSVAE